MIGVPPAASVGSSFVPDRRWLGWLVVSLGIVVAGYEFDFVRQSFYGSRPPIYVVIGPLALAAVYGVVVGPLLPKVTRLERFVVAPFLFALPTVYRQGGLFFTVVPWAFVIAWYAPRGRMHRAVAGIAVLFVAALTFSHGISNFAVRKLIFEFVPTWVATLAAAVAVVFHLVDAKREAPASAFLAGLVTSLMAIEGLVPPAIRASATAVFLLSWFVPSLASHRSWLALPALVVFVDGDRAKAASALFVFVLGGIARRAVSRMPEASRPGLRAFSAFILAWLMCWNLFGCRASGIDFGYFLSFLGPDARIEDSWILNAATTTALVLGLAGVAAETVGSFRLMRLVRLVAIRCLLLSAFLVGFSKSPTDFGPMRIADVVQESLVPVVVLASVALATFASRRAQARTASEAISVVSVPPPGTNDPELDPDSGSVGRWGRA